MSCMLGLHPPDAAGYFSRSRGPFLKRRLLLIALAGLAALASAPQLPSQPNAARPQAQATTESVLAMMDKSAADFRSLTADLENTKYTDVVKDSSVETGHIYVRRDQKMRIEIIKPDPRTILRTGDSLYMYTPKIKRVEEFDLGKNRAMVDQYVLLGFGTKSSSTATTPYCSSSLPSPTTFVRKSPRSKCGSILLPGFRSSRNFLKPVRPSIFNSTIRT